jgi:uncharacterized membrane protein YfcA
MFDFLNGSWNLSGKRKREYNRLRKLTLIMIVPIGVVGITAGALISGSAPHSLGQKVGIALLIITAVVVLGQQLYLIAAHKTNADFLTDEFKHQKQRSEQNKQELMEFIESVKKGQK